MGLRCQGRCRGEGKAEDGLRQSSAVHEPVHYAWNRKRRHRPTHSDFRHARKPERCTRHRHSELLHRQIVRAQGAGLRLPRPPDALRTAARGHSQVAGSVWRVCHAAPSCPDYAYCRARSPKSDVHEKLTIVDGLIFWSDRTTESLQRGNVAAANVTVCGFQADFLTACDDLAGWHNIVSNPSSGWHLVRSINDIEIAKSRHRVGLIM